MFQVSHFDSYSYMPTREDSGKTSFQTVTSTFVGSGNPLENGWIVVAFAFSTDSIIVAAPTADARRSRRSVPSRRRRHRRAAAGRHGAGLPWASELWQALVAP